MMIYFKKILVAYLTIYLIFSPYIPLLYAADPIDFAEPAEDGANIANQLMGRGIESIRDDSIQTNGLVNSDLELPANQALIEEIKSEISSVTDSTTNDVFNERVKANYRELEARTGIAMSYSEYLDYAGADAFQTINQDLRGINIDGTLDRKSDITEFTAGYTAMATRFNAVEFMGDCDKTDDFTEYTSETRIITREYECEKWRENRSVCVANKSWRVEPVFNPNPATYRNDRSWSELVDPFCIQCEANCIHCEDECLEGSRECEEGCISYCERVTYSITENSSFGSFTLASSSKSQGTFSFNYSFQYRNTKDGPDVSESSFISTNIYNIVNRTVDSCQTQREECENICDDDYLYCRNDCKVNIEPCRDLCNTNSFPCLTVCDDVESTCIDGCDSPFKVQDCEDDYATIKTKCNSESVLQQCIDEGFFPPKSCILLREACLTQAKSNYDDCLNTLEWIDKMICQHCYDDSLTCENRCYDTLGDCHDYCDFFDGVCKDECSGEKSTCYSNCATAPCTPDSTEEIEGTLYETPNVAITLACTNNCFDYNPETNCDDCSDSCTLRMYDKINDKYTVTSGIEYKPFSIVESVTRNCGLSGDCKYVMTMNCQSYPDTASLSLQYDGRTIHLDENNCWINRGSTPYKGIPIPDEHDPDNMVDTIFDQIFDPGDNNNRYKNLCSQTQELWSCADGPLNYEVDNECEPYETNDDCILKKIAGSHYYYDCTETFEVVTGVEGGSIYDCGDGFEIRCVGDECSDQESESSGRDLAHAVEEVTILSSISYAAEPIDDSGEIEIFKGKEYTCKNHKLPLAPNCCSKHLAPVSMNWIELAILTKQAWDISKKLKAVEMLKTTKVATITKEAWINATIYVKDAMATAWSTVTKPITSAYAEATGASTLTAEVTALESATVDPSAMSAAAEAVSQKFYEYTYKSIEKTAGQNFANKIFAVSANDEYSLKGAETTIAEFTSKEFASKFMTALQVIWYIYIIYTVYKILIMIFCNCGESEMHLSFSRQGKLCYKTKTKKKKRMYTTIYKKEYWCCFNSLLARLISEQAYEQLGINKKTAKCRGLTEEELEALDFEAMDFTEWYTAFNASIVHRINNSSTDSVYFDGSLEDKAELDAELIQQKLDEITNE